MKEKAVSAGIFGIVKENSGYQRFYNSVDRFIEGEKGYCEFVFSGVWGRYLYGSRCQTIIKIDTPIKASALLLNDGFMPLLWKYAN